MKGCFIDTNVIMRYLLDDNEEQALIAEHLIDGGAWTTPEVLAEVTYVLDSVYEVKRDEITTALEMMANVLTFQPDAVTRSAIGEFGRTKLDFVDCMAVAYGLHGERVFTFDKEVNKQLLQR